MANRNTYSEVAAGTGDLDLDPRCSNATGLFQVTLNSGATGTITLKAKISGDHDWVTIATITGTDLVQCVIAPFMRASYSTSGGTIDVGLWEAL